MVRTAKCNQAGCSFCDPEDVIDAVPARAVRMYAPHFVTPRPPMSLHALLQDIFLTEDDLDKVICLGRGKTVQLCDGFKITRTV